MTAEMRKTFALLPKADKLRHLAELNVFSRRFKVVKSMDKRAHTSTGAGDAV